MMQHLFGYFHLICRVTKKPAPEVEGILTKKIKQWTERWFADNGKCWFIRQQFTVIIGDFGNINCTLIGRIQGQ